MNDLSRSVIDLAISTIKKTHHGVTIASVSGKFQPDKEVNTLLHNGEKNFLGQFSSLYFFFSKNIGITSWNNSIAFRIRNPSSCKCFLETGEMLWNSDLVRI